MAKIEMMPWGKPLPAGHSCPPFSSAAGLHSTGSSALKPGGEELPGTAAAAPSWEAGPRLPTQPLLRRACDFQARSNLGPGGNLHSSRSVPFLQPCSAGQLWRRDALSPSYTPGLISWLSTLVSGLLLELY